MTVLPALVHALEALPLVDHHVHSILRDPLSDTALIDALTEADHAFSREGALDSQLGMAVRRDCAPILGLAPFASLEEYLTARRGIGYDEATRRFLTASGISTYLIDGGYQPEVLLPEERMMALADATSHPIVRLETTAEAVMAESTSGADFLDRLVPALESAARGAVGWKSVAAYRCGLDLTPEEPSADDLRTAASTWFDAGADGEIARLTDRTLIRHLAGWALERGDVVQFHAGFGGTNLELSRANPALLQPFAAATQETGGRIVLLHCYPFMREAGFLAHLYPHVYLDAGLSINYLGANADTVVRETLDLAPFRKVLFSSDAWGLPELVYLGAKLWRESTGRVLNEYIETHGWPVEEAVRVAELVAWKNAEQLYGRNFVSD